jgi:hypothetical protein
MFVLTKDFSTIGIDSRNSILQFLPADRTTPFVLLPTDQTDIVLLQLNYFVPAKPIPNGMCLQQESANSLTGVHYMFTII